MRAVHVSISSRSPAGVQALKLTRVYGINLDAHGPNLFAAAGNCVVYAVAAICVVHELESGGQRFFHGHRDDISALAVDAEGKIEKIYLRVKSATMADDLINDLGLS